MFGAHGKYIFRKCFSILMYLWCKMISVFILPSNTIFRKTERERVCVSEIMPARKERERKKREPIAGDPRASTSPATQRLRATNLDRSSTSTSNRTQIAPFDFASEPKGQDHTPLTSHPSTSPRWHWDSTDRTEFAIKKWLGFDEFDRVW